MDRLIDVPFNQLEALKLSVPDDDLTIADLIRQRNFWWDRAEQVEEWVLSWDHKRARAEVIDQLAAVRAENRAEIEARLEDLWHRQGRDLAVFRTVHEWRKLQALRSPLPC